MRADFGGWKEACWTTDKSVFGVQPGRAQPETSPQRKEPRRVFAPLRTGLPLWIGTGELLFRFERVHTSVFCFELERFGDLSSGSPRDMNQSRVARRGNS